MYILGRFKKIANQEGYTRRIASKRRYWDEQMTSSIQLLPSQIDRLVLKYSSGKRKVIYLD